MMMMNAGGQKEISLSFVLRTFPFEILKGKALGTRMSVPCENMLRKRKVELVTDFLLSRDQKYKKVPQDLGPCTFSWALFGRVSYGYVDAHLSESFAMKTTNRHIA